MVDIDFGCFSLYVICIYVKLIVGDVFYEINNLDIFEVRCVVFFFELNDFFLINK